MTTVDNFPRQELLKIGQVASISGVSIKTLRYYDHLGLLAPNIVRNSAGYRLFNSSIFKRLSFIRRSQSLGLSLTEIENILNIYDKGEVPCGVAKEVLIDKLDNIKKKIDNLTILQGELKAILSGWHYAESLDENICPNIQKQVD